MFGRAGQKKAAERQRRLHIAGSDWLIGKPNSSKLIGIINSTRAVPKERETRRERERERERERGREAERQRDRETDR